MDVNNNLTSLNLKVKCDLCEKSLFGEFLSKHMRVSHLSVERPIKKKPQHLNDKNDLKFFCKFCKKAFAVKREMKRHKKNVHLSNGNSKAVEKLIWKKLKPIEDGRVKCLDCSKTYSNRGIEKTHYKNLHMTDKNVRNIKCKVCNKDFAVGQYLRKNT
jgi:hypothetical protein